MSPAQPTLIRSPRRAAESPRNSPIPVWGALVALMRRLLVGLGMVWAVAGLGGCASPEIDPDSRAPVPLQQAVRLVTDELLSQANHLRRWGSRLGPSGHPLALRIAPVADGRPFAAPEAAELTARWLAEELRQPAAAGFALAPASEPAVRWQLRARLSPPPAVAGRAAEADMALLSLELVDADNGEVVAAARARVGDAVLARRAAPPPEPPVARPAPPTPAPPPAPPSLAALSADYVALLRRGKDVEAQAVFSQIVSVGLATRQLDVKLLFAPASAEFWPDPVLRRRYALWLAEIARQLPASPHCLRIVGHASRTGSPAYNQRLSERRAQAVRQMLLRQAPSLAPRLEAVGMGFEENLAGTGTDDERDVSDRRVVFKVTDCP